MIPNTTCSGEIIQEIILNYKDFQYK